MKVVVFFDNFGPYHLARLKAAGGVCTLLALQINSCSRDYPWKSTTRASGFASVTLRDRGCPRPLATLLKAEELKRVLAQFGPDCVFIPGWSCYYSWAALNWSQAREIPVVIMSETTRHDSARSPWKEWFKGRMVRRCAAGLVGGEPHAKYLAELGMGQASIFQGYDVVDNDYFARTTEAVRKRAKAVRLKYGLPARYLLASARFIEPKNLPGLLTAFAEYRSAACRGERTGAQDARPAWSLVLLGAGKQESALRRAIRDLGLMSCVLMPGFKQYAELPIYYGLADAFVQASTSEPWGLVVNEAMASGLPVLVSNRCGCAPDLVCEGVNGFAFDPQNTSALAKLMLRAWESEAQLSLMGRASSRIVSNWGPARFAEGFYAAAQKAVSQRAPRLVLSSTGLHLCSGK